LQIVFLGLSITSSWGNGHATTYRALIEALRQLGHRIHFLERDVPWYAEHRDAPAIAGCEVELYDSLDTLSRRFAKLVRNADAVIVGSYVPEGAEVVRWVLDVARGLRLFYDLDTPVTLGCLARGEATYIAPQSIPLLDAYLSFSGGAALARIEDAQHASIALPLYCSVDTHRYTPRKVEPVRDLGYLGTYSADRQPTLEQLLLEPARAWLAGRFTVAGSNYPTQEWPQNVERIEHVAPDEHPSFYSSLRYTLNVTRADMRRLGHSPSVRLFEAAACGVPIISDSWVGLDEFFQPGTELLLAESPAEVLAYLRSFPEEERRAIAGRARKRVLREHSALRRAALLEHYLLELSADRAAALRGRRRELPRPTSHEPSTRGATVTDS